VSKEEKNTNYHVKNEDNVDESQKSLYKNMNLKFYKIKLTIKIKNLNCNSHFLVFFKKPKKPRLLKT